SIVFESLLTIEGAFFAGPPTTIARDPAGGFYLRDADGMLQAYGSDGRFVRQIGQRGAGPGEYERVRNVLVSRDGSIHVLDAALGRHSKFSRDGEFLGSTSAPVVLSGVGMDAVFLPDDRIALNALGLNDPLASGHALQVIDQGGNTTPFGEASPSDLRRPWRQQRLLWARPNGELLVARPYAFTIDVYASDLTKRMSIRRVADWIPSQDQDLEEQPSDGVFDKPPTPMLQLIWEDEQGLLWLGMLEPSGSWRPGPPVEQMRKDQGLNQDTVRTLADRPRFETILEVVDLERQRVLARYSTGDPIGTHFGGGYFALRAEDSVGEPIIRISRVRLRQ
ncbi:MAG: 6-bladed beta-propeller, partial [bacterium]